MHVSYSIIYPIRAIGGRDCLFDIQPLYAMLHLLYYISLDSYLCGSLIYDNSCVIQYIGYVLADNYHVYEYVYHVLVHFQWLVMLILSIENGTMYRNTFTMCIDTFTMYEDLLLCLGILVSCLGAHIYRLCGIILLSRPRVRMPIKHVAICPLSTYHYGIKRRVYILPSLWDILSHSAMPVTHVKSISIYIWVHPQYACWKCDIDERY
jgi:hypothetical protein